MNTNVSSAKTLISYKPALGPVMLLLVLRDEYVCVCVCVCVCVGGTGLHMCTCVCLSLMSLTNESKGNMAPPRSLTTPAASLISPVPPIRI